MGIFGDLLAGAASGTIKGTFEGVGSLIKDIRSALTGEISAEKKAELLDKAIEAEAALKMGQVQVNIAEAQHKSIFVAGWRPMIGWVGGLALACYFIPQYLLASVLWVKYCWAAQAISAFPVPEPGGLIELVGLMLGVGALRTIEKIKGVNSL